MLTLEQYRILNVCADDVELFYVPFAEVNFGGQVFPRSKGPGYEQYEDQQPWPIVWAGSEIAADLAHLIRAGLVRCWRVLDDAEGKPTEVETPSDSDFAAYDGYDCITWEQHNERFGYGPHVFKTSARGVAELNKDEYRMFDAALGWM